MTSSRPGSGTPSRLIEATRHVAALPARHRQTGFFDRAILTLLLSCGCLAAGSAHAFDSAGSTTPIAAQGTIQAAFAPWDNIEGLIVESIGAAKKQVLMQAYLFSSKVIANALIAASQRGIDVRVLVDAEQSIKQESSKVEQLAAAGIRVWKETAYQAAHNKIILVDTDSAHPILITGSYNFTWSAQHKNAENILIVRDNLPLTAKYALNWERHRQGAVLYQK